MSLSGFIKSVLDVCPWCLSCLDSLSVFVLHSPAEVNLRTIWRRQLLLITFPCWQPDLVSSNTVVNELSFEGGGLTLFKEVSPRMRVTWELIRGLGNAGSSLPSVQAYLTLKAGSVTSSFKKIQLKHIKDIWLKTNFTRNVKELSIPLSFW